MERLIEPRGVLNAITKAGKDIEFLKGVVIKLSDYEDTGLTPEEIKDILSVLSENQDDVDEDGISMGLIHELLELARYRQAEEQGLLITLPCKVGDAVYWINSYGDEYEKRRISPVQVQCYTWWLTHGFCVKIANMYEGIPCLDKSISEFGKTVFLTREAAEQALKEGR